MTTPAPASDDEGLSAVLARIESARLTLQTLTSNIEAHAPAAAAAAAFPSCDDDDTAALSTYPGALLAELEHYRELFSQLRFSYLEQMTKEKFLRYVTEEPPAIHDADENAAREAELAGAKESLQRCKREVDATLAEIDDVGRRLAPAYERLKQSAAQARSLSTETAAMRAQIAALRGAADDRPEMNLPLDDTLRRVGAAESELSVLESELATLRDVAAPRARKLLAQLDREIAAREKEKDGLQRFADEAVKARRGAREAGNADREIAGQWYKSSYEILSALLGEEPAK